MHRYFSLCASSFYFVGAFATTPVVCPTPSATIPPQYQGQYTGPYNASYQGDIYTGVSLLVVGPYQYDMFVSNVIRDGIPTGIGTQFTNCVTGISTGIDDGQAVVNITTSFNNSNPYIILPSVQCLTATKVNVSGTILLRTASTRSNFACAWTVPDSASVSLNVVTWTPQSAAVAAKFAASVLVLSCLAILGALFRQ